MFYIDNIFPWDDNIYFCTMQNGNDNLNFYKVWICYLAFFIAGSQFFVVITEKLRGDFNKLHT